MASEFVVHPVDILRKVSLDTGLRVDSKQFAEHLDSIDELKNLRKEFSFPKVKALPNADLSCINGDADSIYLCGNSLGLSPRNTKKLIDEEMLKWQEMGVLGHQYGKRPWQHIQEFVVDQMAKVVGAKPIEVIAMNTLTVNLHMLMVAFYRPSQSKYKILVEGKAFPSDHYAVESQAAFHGFDPKKAIVVCEPRPGEDLLRLEDIILKIEQEGHEIALIMFSGVQYYTGQFFDMKSITDAGHKKGCKVGFDLAHAVGNVEMKLHEWNVDFACWCTYKYLNAGPGSIGGVFVHEKYAYDPTLRRFTGWWGTEFKERFNMDNNNFQQIPGARGFQCSNPCVLSTVSLLSSLEIFDKVGMKKLISKQRLLTGYLEYLIKIHFSNPQLTRADSVSVVPTVKILTPEDVAQRGCQLSLVFSVPANEIHSELSKRGVVCDYRRPNVIRVAPVPLYNSFSDVHRFVETIQKIILS